MAFELSLIGKDIGPRRFAYDWQRTALHALACGAGPGDLDLLLETRGPKVLGSFSVVIANDVLFETVLGFGGNLLTLLHGAQKCVLHRPLPAEGPLLVTARIEGLYDKGKGALSVVRVRGATESGAPLFETESQIFYRGEGGFGGERGPGAPTHEPPARAPDHSVAQRTQPTQALLYRLASGDTNPLHSDPEIAAAAGYPRPILHGLCSFGHAELAAVQTLCGGDPGRIASIEGRLAKPVFPGETLVTDLWRTGEREALFATRSAERGEPCITLGRVVLR